jgi:hypothetical protein
MDEKTEELRDIFIDVADSETVTESQEDSRGSLTDDGEVKTRLLELIADMRDRYGFRTDLSDQQLCELANQYFEGVTDADLAREFDIDRRAAFRARLDLHLFRDRDTDAPFDMAAFRQQVTSSQEVPTSELATTFDVSESTARRYRRVVEARDESRRANDRYRDEFAELLADADISGALTHDAREDGLDDATDGMETDVSF